MESFLHDISWVLQFRSPANTELANAFTFLGYLPFYLIVLPLGYWLWDKDMFTRLAVVAMLSAIVNSFAKDLFQDPRPDLIFALDKRVGDSYGMPSGHAQVVATMWFWFAYEMKRWWIWMLAAIITAGVCLSRIYLGVHDVEDVLAGIGLAIGTLLIFRLFISDRFNHWHNLHPAGQIAVIVAATIVLWLLWPSEKGPGPYVGIFAFLLGWWAGVIYDRNRLDFKRHPSWLITLLGVTLALFVIFIVTGLAFKGYSIADLLVSLGLGTTFAGYVQMLLVALFVTALVPLLFETAKGAKGKN